MTYTISRMDDEGNMITIRINQRILIIIVTKALNKVIAGDQDGDPFYDLSDVEDFIRNNDQVDQYLYELVNQ